MQLERSQWEWHKMERTRKQESNHGSPSDDFSHPPKVKGKPLKE